MSLLFFTGVYKVCIGVFLFHRFVEVVVVVVVVVLMLVAMLVVAAVAAVVVLVAIRWPRL